MSGSQISAPAPVFRVLGIFELARAILGNLGGRDLLNAQATCRLLCEHARAMKLELTKGIDAAIKVKTEVDEEMVLNPLLRLILRPPTDYVQCEPDMSNHQHTFYVSRPQKDHEYDWKSMFLTRPPISTACVTLIAEDDRYEPEIVWVYANRHVNDPDNHLDGATIGDIIDFLDEAYEDQRGELCMLTLGGREITTTEQEVFGDQFSDFCEKRSMLRQQQNERSRDT